MKSYETLSRNVRRIRQKGNSLPSVPVTLADFILPEEYMVTLEGQQFLLHDNEDPFRRTMIFATKENISFLAHCDEWYMDGTFDICPPLFSQLYTIHGRRNNLHFPLVYVLASKKDYFTYEGLFNQLKVADKRLQQKKIMIDFEKAAHKAAEDVFEGVEVSGCFFHFCQCLYRKIQECGLKKTYIEDATFAMNMRCITALAFVPVHNVVNNFEKLKKLKFFSKKLKGKSDVDFGVQKLLLYMESTWIGKQGRKSYKPGMFQLKMWNVYQLTLDLFPRTNNIVEAWHNTCTS
ncbi:hypothetical protein Bhyg_13144 [Pseudolycoriella hygida]|uniref:MULE transposase domain-containing protein n=1 Tax=Pseudolycoriella hygida TaxID=35572 RepID=A0A9Q0S1W6_9DIPT|nr:hypothetical protein Bhyg_13144 [Pseudolycoriella hygida]